MTLQLVKPISLSDVYAEFSAPNGTALGAFVRGGSFVDDHPENSGVPTSKPISLSQLLGASKSTRLIMIAGDFEFATTGYNDGSGFVDQIGTLTPNEYTGREIFHLHRDNSGLQTTIFQQNAGDIDQFYWTRMVINGPLWNNFEMLASSRAGIADNNGGFTWSGMNPTPGRFVEDASYTVDWE